MEGSTWLCPTAFDRTRLVDMEARLRSARGAMFVFLALAFLASAPWYGWWILFPLAWTVIFYPLVHLWMARSELPEYPIAATVINAQLVIGTGVAITGGPHSPALPLLLLAVVTLPARFTTRGVIAGLVLTVGVLGGVVALDPRSFLENPTFVIAVLGCLGGLTAVSHSLMRSEVHHRTRAVLDPLTGLLNREGLADRFDELAVQAAVTGGSIALVVGDLDRFKAVNDAHGHERGDAVLRDVAYLLRKNLRSFELVYRMGGEEFLIVLPGAELLEARVIAEQARAAIEAHGLGGLPVTISMGIAAARGEAIAFGALYGRADEALYEAKRTGRNRVASLDPTPVAPEASRGAGLASEPALRV